MFFVNLVKKFHSKLNKWNFLYVILAMEFQSASALVVVEERAVKGTVGIESFQMKATNFDGNDLGFHRLRNR